MNQDVRDWLEWMPTTSVPLFHLNGDDLPTGSASGTFIDYHGRRLLLSVQHAVNRGANGWVVLLGNERERGASVFPLRDFNYVAEMTRGSERIHHIDFCYVEVPNDLTSIFQHASPRGSVDERPRHVFVTELASSPDPNQVFAFAGQVKTEMHGTTAVVGDMVVFPGLRYVRTEQEFHVFQLPVPHPGHDEFKGCSGAPIVDMNRTVVAVLCNGDAATNTVRGVSLARYRFAFDFILGLTNGA